MKLNDATRGEALRLLRRLHADYVIECGDRFAHVPFSARDVPGWSYDSVRDCVEPKAVPTDPRHPSRK